MRLDRSTPNVVKGGELSGEEGSGDEKRRKELSTVEYSNKSEVSKWFRRESVKISKINS